MKKVVFELTDEQFAHLKSIANKMGVSKKEALRRAIEIYQFIKGWRKKICACDDCKD